MYINIFAVLDPNNRYVISIPGGRLNFHGCWKLTLNTAKSFRCGEFGGLVEKIFHYSYNRCFSQLG